jgi:integrase
VFAYLWKQQIARDDFLGLRKEAGLSIRTANAKSTRKSIDLSRTCSDPRIVSLGTSASSDIIKSILEGDALMPKKYQNGKLEVRDDVARPYYYIRVTVPKMTHAGRKRMRESRILGFVDEISKKEAMKRRAAELEKVNAGRVVARSIVRFSDLVARYESTRIPQLGFAAQARYRSMITNHLLPALGELKLSEISREKIEQLLAAKSEQLGWWARTNLKGILSAIFAAAKDWNLWEGDNPTTGVRIGKKKLVREKRLLAVEDLRKLIAALPDHVRFLVLLMFGLGLRISEALGLRWRDIDFDAATLTVRRRWYRGDLSEEEQTKTEASAAELRLSASMLAELKQRYPGAHRREEFLFIGDDGHVPPDDRDLLRFEFRPVLKKLGLYYPGFGWHAFRRQNITWRQQVGGATPLEAQKGARHASLDMTYLYSLTDVERETAQQQRMFDHLLGLPGTEKPQ